MRLSSRPPVPPTRHGRTGHTRTGRTGRSALAALAATTAAVAAAVAVAAVPADAGTDGRGAADRTGARAETTRVDPARLERGPDAKAPYVDGRTIHDDGTATRVRGRWVQLLGTRPDGRYVVLVRRDGRDQVRAQTPGGGSRKILGDTYGAEPVLGSDGPTLVTGLFKTRPRRHSLLRAYDSTSGELLGTRKRRGYLTPLDADSSTVVYAGENGPVVAWDLAGGTGTRLSSRYGYRADLGNDRLVVFTDDPYDGGCTVLSLLSDPAQELWRSCDEAVRAISPDGSHVLTVFKLADGLGPSQVHVRTADGVETGRYEVDGFFEHYLFEDGDTVLLGAVTRESSGTVRCDAGDCELASDLGKGAPWL
jgi:hypothetical protein